MIYKIGSIESEHVVKKYFRNKQLLSVPMDLGTVIIKISKSNSFKSFQKHENIYWGDILSNIDELWIYIQLPDESRCLSRIDKFSKTCEQQKKALFACFYKANDIKVTSIYKAYHDKIHMQNSLCFHNYLYRHVSGYYLVVYRTMPPY